MKSITEQLALKDVVSEKAIVKEKEGLSAGAIPTSWTAHTNNQCK